jgi:hypothetical protein
MIFCEVGMPTVCMDDVKWYYASYLIISFVYNLADGGVR